MPGYTHLQRAQPVYLGHHLLAYFWMLSRDARRFAFAAESASVMPLGSGALAGVNWPIDRKIVAAELGFAAITPNSLDGTSNRDFVIDYLSAAATCAMHLSRLGSELVIWSSSEFGFVELDEGFSSGSSIMPQKKNPDSAELLRAKSPRVRRRPPDAARRDARAAAHLRQGHAGGQGAALGRDRHGRVEPRGDGRDPRGHRLRPGAAGGGLRRRDAGRDRGRRPAGPPGRDLPRRPRDRRRAGPRSRSPATSRSRVSAARRSPASPRPSPATPPRSSTRCSSAARGWSRRRSPAAPAPSPWRPRSTEARTALTDVREAAGA